MRVLKPILKITDDAIIFGEGTDKQVTVDASGIHVGKKSGRRHCFICRC